MVIRSVFIEGRVTQIGPQHGYHPQLMGTLEGSRDLFNLTARLLRAEIDGGTHRDSTQIEGLLDAGVEGLVIFGGVAQGFVVIQFHQERNTVRVTAGDRRQHAVSGSHAVTARLDRQFHDVLRIKIERVGGEGCARRVFHPLIHRQDRKIAGSAQTPGVIQRLHIAQHRRWAVVVHHYAVNVIVARKIKLVGWNGHTTML